MPASGMLGSGSAAACPVERPRELLDVERIAAAFPMKGGCVDGSDGLAEELPRLGRRQRAELDAGQHGRAMCALESAKETLRQLAGAERRAPMSTAAAGGRRSSAPEQLY